MQIANIIQLDKRMFILETDTVLARRAGHCTYGLLFVLMLTIGLLGNWCNWYYLRPHPVSQIYEHGAPSVCQYNHDVLMGILAIGAIPLLAGKHTLKPFITPDMNFVVLVLISIPLLLVSVVVMLVWLITIINIIPQAITKLIMYGYVFTLTNKGLHSRRLMIEIVSNVNENIRNRR
jgi:hypothetical protein